MKWRWRVGGLFLSVASFAALWGLMVSQHYAPDWAFGEPWLSLCMLLGIILIPLTVAGFLGGIALLLNG